MPVLVVTEAVSSKTATLARPKNPAGFSKVLDSAVDKTKKDVIPRGRSDKTGSINLNQTSYLKIGVISKKTPTVSHILKDNPMYREKCWDIISASKNQGKNFTNMRDGAQVALNPANNELIWGKGLSFSNKTPKETIPSDGIQSARKKEFSDKLIQIGTISKDKPTVSHLFKSNPGFDNDFWKIINARINSDKNYTSLRPGTMVTLNPRTRELFFNRNSFVESFAETPGITRPEQNDSGMKVHDRTLADAVKPFIGKPYKDVDCYGLVVRGLINQGVHYHGHGGLREKLERLAELKGLPRNSYLNGEGLVKQAGTKVYSKAIPEINNIQEQTNKLYSEIKPSLRKGLILSFSTPTRGHTGIISRQGDNWTYINSGLIDNQIFPGKVSERVGEEFLKEEIENWISITADRKESLIVTMGDLNEEKLRNLNVLRGENELVALNVY